LYVVAACSSPAGGAASGPISIEQLPAQFAAKICQSLGPCCQANGTPYDSATCQQTAQAALTVSTAKLNKATVKYNASAASACIDAYASAIARCSEVDFASVLTACDAVFTGTLPAGAACSVDEECATPPGGSASCATSSVAPSGNGGASGASSGDLGGATRSCVQRAPAPHGKAGDACAGDCTLAASGIGCSSLPPSAGVGPTLTTLCYRDEGLYCGANSLLHGSTTPAASACAPIAAIGSPCTANGCVDGAFCNAGTCAAQYDSGPCGAGASDACSRKSYCDYANGYLCLPRLAEGAACTSGSTCQSDYCQYPAAGSSSGGASPPASGGSGGAGPVVSKGVCAKLTTFASPQACMGQLDG
jgi:hypothetical protein